MRIPFFALSLAALAGCVTQFAHGAGGEAFTDPAKAGPDFAVQGEYAGSINIQGQSVKVGLHVIAQGDGKFAGVGYHGGVPGDGWKKGDHRTRSSGKTENGVTTLVADDGQYRVRIENGKATALNLNGEALGTLDKLERKSPTLGAKPPAGAIVLFDGSNADHFPGAKMTDDHLLKAGAIGKDEFTDYTLHIEFRTPFMPTSTGQGRGNSGVYLQNRYEVQVLDSFGLEGENNECGGLYSVNAPMINMCYPPLSWQTYDIEHQAARFDGDKKTQNTKITIKHNGVTIYDHYEMPRNTPGGAETETPGRGPIMLQDHGNPVVFRNIWVVEKK